MEHKSISSSLSAGNQVLVVEDELRVRDMLTRALKEMGFQSTLAPTAEAALKAIAEKTFDIVILDLNLPGMDGMAFLKTIRDRANFVEVIILTGFGDLEAAKSAIHLDVVDFITKPYALGTLEVALDRARKRARARNLEHVSNAAVDAPVENETPPSPKRAFNDSPTPDEALDEVERRQILRVLQKQNGNRANAAAELGISLRKLYYRLGEYERRGLL